MAKKQIDLSIKEKVNYLKIALSLQQIGVNEETTERIIATYEKILEIGGEFSIDDAVDIQLILDKKYAEIRVKSNSEV